MAVRVFRAAGGRQGLARIGRAGDGERLLVREDDGLTLIDTMIGRSAGKVGSLDELKENLPQAEVISRLATRGFSQGT
jgi:hypothetical protein